MDQPHDLILPGANVDARPKPPDIPGLPFECWWDSSHGDFLIEDDHGELQHTCERDIQKRLRNAGVDWVKDKETGNSSVDNLILKVKSAHNIFMCTEVAGYEKGWHRICGNNILVPRGPAILPSHQGDWPDLRRLWEGMFIDPDHPDDLTQILVFHAWNKLNDACLRLGPNFWHPGQALVFVGLAACGKSWTQNLITLMLGGRVGKPFQLMIGRTDFNSECAKAEHQMWEDETCIENFETRQNMGSMIKQLSVNEVQSFHAKGKDKFEIRPFWRLTASTNPNHISVLPPLDDAIADKIIILKCFSPRIPFPPRMTLEGRLFGNAVNSQLCKYMRWLRNDFQIPQYLMESRYGVISYHHPEIKEALNELSPEYALKQLVSEFLLKDKPKWEGRSSDLEKDLMGTFDPICIKRASALLRHRNSCGTLLSKLAQRPESGVTFHRTQEARLYTIVGNSTGSIRVDRDYDTM